MFLVYIVCSWLIKSTAFHKLMQISYQEGLDGNNILVLKERDVKIITDLMMGLVKYLHPVVVASYKALLADLDMAFVALVASAALAASVVDPLAYH